jgi:hypothetical protein
LCAPFSAGSLSTTPQCHKAYQVTKRHHNANQKQSIAASQKPHLQPKLYVVCNSQVVEQGIALEHHANLQHTTPHHSTAQHSMVMVMVMRGATPQAVHSTSQAC